MRAWLAIIILMLSPIAAQAADGSKSCDVTVMFSSNCCGIDYPTYQSVKAVLDADESLSVRRTQWGSQGDFSLCISTDTDAHAKALYNTIVPLLPPASRDSTRGYTKARMKGDTD